MKVILLVLDGVGVGSLPDANEYGTSTANTLVNSLGNSRLDQLPFLKQIGFSYFFGENDQLKKGVVGKLAPITKENDTAPIHWEMMGIKDAKRHTIYPNGIPQPVLNKLEQETEYKFIGNVMVEYGDTLSHLRDEHKKTKHPIIYCTTDSVVQVAAMEEYIPIENLYAICKVLRRLLPNVGRVIAKPFIINEDGNYERNNKKRRDYAISIPNDNFLLPKLEAVDIATIGVGKIGELFQNLGISKSIKTGSNTEGIATTIEVINNLKKGLVFANLTDFDMMGHSNNVQGMIELLKELDDKLPSVIDSMGDEDLLILTSDHGCDPTQSTKTHTREYGILLCFQKRMQNKLAYVGNFADLASVTACYFGINFNPGNVFYDFSQ